MGPSLVLDSNPIQHHYYLTPKLHYGLDSNQYLSWFAWISFVKMV